MLFSPPVIIQKCSSSVLGVQVSACVRVQRHVHSAFFVLRMMNTSVASTSQRTFTTAVVWWLNPWNQWTFVLWYLISYCYHILKENTCSVLDGFGRGRSRSHCFPRDLLWCCQHLTMTQGGEAAALQQRILCLLLSRWAKPSAAYCKSQILDCTSSLQMSIKISCCALETLRNCCESAWLLLSVKIQGLDSSLVFCSQGFAQPGLRGFTCHICLQLCTKPSHTSKHSLVVVFRISHPKSWFLRFLYSPVGMERTHLQELSRAEVHRFMQSELFARRLSVLLPILKFCFCYFSVVLGVSAGCRLLYRCYFQIWPFPCVCCIWCITSFSLLRYLFYF